MTTAKLIGELIPYTRRKSGTQTLAKVPVDLLLRTIDVLDSHSRVNQSLLEQPRQRHLEPGQYLIRSLRDFAQIPADKLPDCLADFAAWIVMSRTSDEFLRDLLNVDGVKLESEFTWIDDGKTGVGRIEFVTPGGEVIGYLCTDEARTIPGSAMFPYGSMGEEIAP